MPSSSIRNVPARRSPYANLAAPAAVAFTVGAEASNAINIAVQVKNAQGQNLKARTVLRGFLSTTASGGVVGTAPSGGVAAGAAGQVLPLVAGKQFDVVTSATGAANVVLTEASTGTFYLNLILPDGTIAVSGAATFV